MFRFEQKIYSWVLFLVITVTVVAVGCSDRPGKDGGDAGVDSGVVNNGSDTGTGSGVTGGGSDTQSEVVGNSDTFPGTDTDVASDTVTTQIDGETDTISDTPTGSDVGADTASDTGGEVVTDTAGTDYSSDPDGGLDGGEGCDAVACDPTCLFYVDVAVSSPDDGTTPQTAFVNIQAGIDAAHEAAGPCCECDVHVAEGRYYVLESSPEDTVQLLPGVNLYGGYPQGFTGDRDVNAHVTVIDGRAEAVALLDGGVADAGVGNSGQVFHVVTGANRARIEGFTVTGGNAREDEDPINPNNYGGGMHNPEASPEVINCRFVHNGAVWGGGMYNVRAEPIIEGCRFEGNEADEAGGGMDNRQGSPVILNSAFLGNTALQGGAMYNGPGSTPSMGHDDSGECLFENNTADQGGGIYNRMGAPSFSECTFKSNLASAGGGMYNENTTLTVATCTFDANSAENGAGVYNDGSDVDVHACSFSGNQGLKGGGIYNDGADIQVADSTFHQNRAIEIIDGYFMTFGDGGGIYSESSTLAVIGSQFLENESVYGGAMANYSSPGTVEDCLFEGNFITIGAESSGGGGAIVDDRSHLAVTGTVFINNDAGRSDGGGISAENSNVVIRGCRFEENTAGGGAGVATRTTDDTIVPIVDRCFFDGNVAQAGGAVILGGPIIVTSETVSIVATAEISNSVFFENEATQYYGGAVQARFLHPIVTNCTFVGNSAYMTGGGMSTDYGDNTGVITNCIFWGNTAPENPQIHNGGRIGNTMEDSRSTVSHSLVQGGCEATERNTCGAGNLTEDPLFVDPLADPPDLSLQQGSPAIDKGDQAALRAELILDAAGNGRFIDIPDVGNAGSDVIDMGAYEYQGGVQ